MVTVVGGADWREFTKWWVGDWPESAAVTLKISGRKKPVSIGRGGATI